MTRRNLSLFPLIFTFSLGKVTFAFLGIETSVRRANPLFATQLSPVDDTSDTTQDIDSQDNVNFRKLSASVCWTENSEPPPLYLDASPDGIRGVFSSVPVKKGDTIFSVPLRHCIRDDEPPEWMDNIDSDISWAARFQFRPEQLQKLLYLLLS